MCLYQHFFHLKVLCVGFSLNITLPNRTKYMLHIIATVNIFNSSHSNYLPPFASEYIATRLPIKKQR